MPPTSSPPLRCLHVLPTLSRGGAELYVERLAREAQARGDAPAVVAMHRGGPVQDLLERAGVPCTVLGIRRSSILKPHRALLDARALRIGVQRAATEHRADLLQTHLPDADWIGLAAARRLGLPAALSYHNPTLLPQDRAATSLRARLRRRQLARTAASADALVAVGEAVAEALLAFPGVRPERVYRIPSGFDARATLPRGIQLDELRREVARELFEDPEVELVVSVGRLVPSKGVELLLEAFREVIRQRPGARLAIVGDGPERERLEQLRRDLELEDHVRLLGARDDVPRLLDAARVFATGTRYEGLGLAAAEALHAERPVAGFDVAGICQVVDHERSGLLVPDGATAPLREAMVALLADPDRAQGMGERGRERSMRFTVAASYTATAELHRALGASGSGTPG